MRENDLCSKGIRAVEITERNMPALRYGEVTKTQRTVIGKESSQYRVRRRLHMSQ